MIESTGKQEHERFLQPHIQISHISVKSNMSTRHNCPTDIFDFPPFLFFFSTLDVKFLFFVIYYSALESRVSRRVAPTGLACGSKDEASILRFVSSFPFLSCLNDQTRNAKLYLNRILLHSTKCALFEVNMWQDFLKVEERDRLEYRFLLQHSAVPSLGTQ